MENITTRRKKNTVITFLKILSFCGFVCLFCICIKRSRIRYIKGKLTGGKVPVRRFGSPWLTGQSWRAIAQGRTQGEHLFCSHDGEFAIKVMLKVQGWDNLSFTGAYDPSCKNVSTMSTMYISAQCEFADIPIASFPGWGICGICTHFHKPGARSPGREKRTKNIADRSARKRVEEV